MLRSNDTIIISQTLNTETLRARLAVLNDAIEGSLIQKILDGQIQAPPLKDLLKKARACQQQLELSVNSINPEQQVTEKDRLAFENAANIEDQIDEYYRSYLKIKELPARTKNLTAKLRSVEEIVEGALKILDSPLKKKDSLPVEYFALLDLLEELEKIKNHIAQLQRGSLIGYIGTERRSTKKNRITFDDANDFANYIEDQIDKCRRFDLKIKEIAADEKRARSMQITDQDFPDWNFDPYADEKYLKRFKDAKAILFSNRITTTENSLSKSEPNNRTFNFRRRTPSACDLFPPPPPVSPTSRSLESIPVMKKERGKPNRKIKITNASPQKSPQLQQSPPPQQSPSRERPYKLSFLNDFNNQTLARKREDKEENKSEKKMNRRSI